MTVRYQAEDGLLVGGVASSLSLIHWFRLLLYSKANGDDVYSEHEVYIHQMITTRILRLLVLLT